MNIVQYAHSSSTPHYVPREPLTAPHLDARLTPQLILRLSAPALSHSPAFAIRQTHPR